MNRNTRLMLYFFVLMALIFGMVLSANRMKAKKAHLQNEDPMGQP